MSRTSLQGQLAISGRLLIGEALGGLWASDTYLMFRVDGDNPVAKILDHWNLPLEVGCYRVRSMATPIRREDHDLPSFEVILSGRDSTQMLVRHTTAGRPTYVRSGSGWAAAYENSVSPDATRLTWADAERLDFLDEVGSTGGWYQKAGAVLTPMYRCEDKDVTAVLMPLRFEALDG